jgi:hypothetical protein
LQQEGHAFQEETSAFIEGQYKFMGSTTRKIEGHTTEKEHRNRGKVWHKFPGNRTTDFGTKIEAVVWHDFLGTNLYSPYNSKHINSGNKF